MSLYSILASGPGQSNNLIPFVLFGSLRFAVEFLWTTYFKYLITLERMHLNVTCLYLASLLLTCMLHDRAFSTRKQLVLRFPSWPVKLAQ